MKTLKEIPTPIKVLAIYLPLLMAAFIFLLSPKLKVLRGLEENLKMLEGELSGAKEIERNFKPPAVGEKRKWEAVKDKIVRSPKGIDFPKLMEELAKLALANNILDVSFSSFRSPPPSQPKETNVNPVRMAGLSNGVKMGDFLIKISFHSQYQDMALFLKGLDNLSQWVVIESLEVKKASPLISAELQVRPISMEK